MSVAQKIFKAPPDSDLSLTLKSALATGHPVFVDTGDEMYTLIVTRSSHMPDEIFVGYDPETAMAGLAALQDALAGVDREELLRDLHEQRAQDSDGRPG